MHKPYQSPLPPLAPAQHRLRRSWLRSGVAALCVSAVMAAGVDAQRSQRGRSAPASDPVPALSRVDNDFREWTIRYGADILPLNPNTGREEFGRRIATRSPSLILSDAAFVFPIIQDTGWTTARNSLIRGTVRAQGELAVDDYAVLPNFQGPSMIGVWRLRNITAPVVRFEVDIPMRSHRVRIDEQRAVDQYPWPPNPYAPEIAVNLHPQLFVQSDHPAIARLVDRWLEGRPARDVPPYRLAKFLAGRVVEHVRPIGTGVSVGAADSGNPGVRVPTRAGFECFGALYAALTGEGTPHDLSNLLCAVYRAAGLPARLTIAVDASEVNHPEHGGLLATRSLVEFYLFNETLGFGEWIPVDIVKQREFGARVPRLEQRWVHFGNMEDGAQLAPIAHHWHPPASVTNAGPPALWGWVTAPGIPLATQNVRLLAIGTPRNAITGPEDGHIAIRDSERRGQRRRP